MAQNLFVADAHGDTRQVGPGSSSSAPTVAVVIPTHQRPALLAESLASVLSQSVAPAEIVVATDVGDDTETADLVSRVAPTARIVRSVGRGASASRNAGYRATSSAIVAFLDDDDRWGREHLEIAVGDLTASGVDAAVVAARQFDDSGFGPVRRMPSGLLASDVIVVNPGVTGSNLVIRRDALDALGGFDEALWVSNDKDLFFRFLERGFSYASVDRVVVDRRRSPGGRLTTSTPARVDGLRAYMAKHHSRLTRRQRRLLRAQIARVSARSAPGPVSATWRRAAALVLAGGPTGLRILRNESPPSPRDVSGGPVG